ncbi:MAG: PTS sugar transporter subunit IIA, partial [Deltaproteobacteria bacterium]|jgi:PTS system nitrogen regulatory IIA component|nr:PTS sugar transporter subunit IIA [Deltaproteobacteria bacterium]
MPLSNYLTPASIVADMTAITKEEALEELVDALFGRCPGLDRDNVLEVLHQRESLGSTGIGYGVAIPHGKMDSCGGVIIAVGRSVAGCDFKALDDHKCHVFSLLLAPNQAAAGYFSVLARLARIFKHREFRRQFMEAADADAIWRLLDAVWRD